MWRGFFGKKLGCVGPFAVVGAYLGWLVMAGGGSELGMAFWFFGFIALGFAVDLLVTLIMKALGRERS